jgi:hypothetical protein
MEKKSGSWARLLRKCGSNRGIIGQVFILAVGAWFVNTSNSKGRVRTLRRR